MMDDFIRDGAVGPIMHNQLKDVPDPDARIVKLEQEKDGTWSEIDTTGEKKVASGSYDFVVQDGAIFAVKEDDNHDWGHTEAAGGKPVTYAGRANFSDAGKLRKWDNGSGHYLPNRSFANNAGLPMENFEPHKSVRGTRVQLPVFQSLLEQSRQNENRADANNAQLGHAKQQGGRTRSS